MCGAFGGESGGKRIINFSCLNNLPKFYIMKGKGGYHYEFSRPYKKQYRVIIHTDCKNEADDQFTVAHALMTPKLDIKAIIAGHFEKNNRLYGAGNTMQASFEEVEKIVSLMGVQEEYAGKLLHGATLPLADETTPNPSEGAQVIIEEAMKEDDRRLFVLLQGCLTDLAAAILMEPKICDRLTGRTAKAGG